MPGLEASIRKMAGMKPIVYPSEFLPDDGNVIFASKEYFIVANTDAAKRMEAEGYPVHWPRQATEG